MSQVVDSKSIDRRTLLKVIPMAAAIDYVGQPRVRAWACLL